MELRTSALLALTALHLAGQTFEAASVKPNTTDTHRQSQTTDGRLYRATNVPARILIRQAYGLMFEDYRLAGAPDWTNFERYDLVATLPEGASQKQMPTMLKALLAERFKLVVHTEVRDSPAYALVLARKDQRLGPQLKLSANGCGTPQADAETCALSIGGEIRGRGQPMDQLAKTLLQFVGRPVANKSQLPGNFDFDIRASEIGGGDELPSIFTAIQEQLGLKLEPTHAPLETVVVDSIEHPNSN
jgi:uncharacterized protein (TIGR03435 family)